jgi:hypothetical protein
MLVVCCSVHPHSSGAQTDTPEGVRRNAAHTERLGYPSRSTRVKREPADPCGRLRQRAEPGLFAAPLVQQRDGSWALVGFRNLEPKGIDAFEILDPIPVELDNEGYPVAS